MTVVQAIDKAKVQLAEVIPDFTGQAVQLEELETPPFGSRWSFTFSTLLPANGTGTSLADVMRGRRISKRIEIDAESGALISVKNAVA